MTPLDMSDSPENSDHSDHSDHSEQIEIIQTIEELLAAYANGQREFEDLDMEGGSVQGYDLTGIEFRYSCFYLDFRDANLTNAKFIDCNIKTTDFRGANLTNALMKGCQVDGTEFEGATSENFRFEENHCCGHTTEPGDFEKYSK